MVAEAFIYKLRNLVSLPLLFRFGICIWISTYL